jgi:hypothetical protein
MARAFYPDSSSMPFNNASTRSETYPSSSDLFTVQPREFGEYLLVVLGRNADAIIRNGGHHGRARVLLGGDMNTGRVFRSPKLQSVADQVLKHLN